jgi:hypothetical protein
MHDQAGRMTAPRLRPPTSASKRVVLRCAGPGHAEPGLWPELRSPDQLVERDCHLPVHRFLSDQLVMPSAQVPTKPCQATTKLDCGVIALDPAIGVLIVRRYVYQAIDQMQHCPLDKEDKMRL